MWNDNSQPLSCRGQIVKIDEICPLAIPNQISTISMHTPSLVKINWLKISSRNENTDRQTHRRPKWYHNTPLLSCGGEYKIDEPEKLLLYLVNSGAIFSCFSINEYPQYMFLWRTGENNSRIIANHSFLTIPLWIILCKTWAKHIHCKWKAKTKLCLVRASLHFFAQEPFLHGVHNLYYDCL